MMSLGIFLMFFIWNHSEYPCFDLPFSIKFSYGSYLVICFLPMPSDLEIFLAKGVQKFWDIFWKIDWMIFNGILHTLKWGFQIKQSWGMIPPHTVVLTLFRQTSVIHSFLPLKNRYDTKKSIKWGATPEKGGYGSWKRKIVLWKIIKKINLLKNIYIKYR